MTKKEYKEMYNRASIIENVLLKTLTKKETALVYELIELELLLEAECNQ